jgi:hypothetical protein
MTNEASTHQQMAHISGEIDHTGKVWRPAQPAPVQDAENKWRTLALQFDAHRMSALAHLRAMVQDPAKHAEVAREFLSAPPPAAQPAPVQPVAMTFDEAWASLSWQEWRTKSPKELFEELHRLTTPPAAPVPDAITDNSESPEYRTGWNECRQAMMEMMK